MDFFSIRCKSCKTRNDVAAELQNKILFCEKCENELQVPNYPIKVSSMNLTEEILEHPGFALIYFWSPSCGYCRSFNHLVEIIAKKKRGFIKIGKMNILECPKIVENNSINVVPTLILLNNGKKIDQIEGIINENHLLIWLGSKCGI